MTSKELKILRKKLPRGYGKIIKERTGDSLTAIYNVANDKMTSETILSALIALAEEHSMMKKQQVEKIKSL